MVMPTHICLHIWAWWVVVVMEEEEEEEEEEEDGQKKQGEERDKIANYYGGFCLIVI